APDKRVRTSSPCVRGASREPIAEAEEKRRGLCGRLSLRRSRSRQHFLGENPCNRTSGGLTSPVGVVAEAPEGVHLGKIGFNIRGVQPAECFPRARSAARTFCGSLPFLTTLKEHLDGRTNTDRHSHIPLHLQPHARGRPLPGEGQ